MRMKKTLTPILGILLAITLVFGNVGKTAEICFAEPGSGQEATAEAGNRETDQGATDQGTSTPDSGENAKTPMTDEEFEAYLEEQGFPETYKDDLWILHKMHPQWIFMAVQTHISWDDLIRYERNTPGEVKNTIQGTSWNPHYSWRNTRFGYNWLTDTWIPYDGLDWFAASDEILAYYMDPRTYLSEQYVFAFESLAYQPTVHTIGGVEAILEGTFMHNAKPKDDKETYAKIIMDAAMETKVSPYHLASRIRQEMGATAGDAAIGVPVGDYATIYNFYNIGAFDSGNALAAGLRWAAGSGSYGRPWTTARKSIVGGARFIGEDYISLGQSTLYTQKFNVTNHEALFYHQYMTNIQAVASEASEQCDAYREKNQMDGEIIFEIPVYDEMPDYVEKPADNGNPNACLKSLTVAGFKLTPEFSYKVNEYSLKVPNGVSFVTIGAEAVSSYASVANIGKVAIAGQETKIPVTVTAQNGNKNTYTITVIRPGFTEAEILAPGSYTGVAYATHVQTYGWQNYSVNGAMSGTSGESKRLEGIKIRVGGYDNLGVTYRTHCQTYGWLNWVSDGAMSGTSGESKRLEAIEIKLTGENADKYDIYYRVHAQSYGWLGWARNGEAAGTSGLSKRLEAIQIVIVNKEADAPEDLKGIVSQYYQPYIVKGGNQYEVDDDTVNVEYSSHVQTYGWQAVKHNGAVSGTSGESKRLEAITISLANQKCEGDIVYRTHVQSYGWLDYVKNGAPSGTSGESKRLEAIQIKLTGEMAEKYDVYYRVHAQNIGWMGWAMNGEMAGTSGYSYRLEAIQIVLKKKGQEGPGLSYVGITAGEGVPAYKNKYEQDAENQVDRTLNAENGLNAAVTPENTVDENAEREDSVDKTNVENTTGETLVGPTVESATESKVESTVESNTESTVESTTAPAVEGEAESAAESEDGKS